MDAKQNLFEMQKEFVKIFNAQDPDSGYFDVVFEIDGKKLYADKKRLSIISPTFKSMLSDRWSFNKNEPIKIKDYKYEDFKEFLRFIYSGECNLNDENIFTMVDMAEFYGVNVFKESCVQYLSNMEINMTNIFQLLDLADKYSLNELQELLDVFVSKNFENLIQAEEFQSLHKSVMKNVIKTNGNSGLSEKLLEEVLKWAEKKAIEKQNVDGNVNLNDAIKEELTDILPLINFQKMELKFLLQCVVKKSFLFSGDELSEILMSAYNRVHVKVIDKNGKTANGILNCPDIDKVVEVIQSQKNLPSSNYYWLTSQLIPSEPSKLIKNAEIEWYLFYDGVGDIGVCCRKALNSNDYLLAEMFAENGFEGDSGCKIEVHRCL